MTDLSVKYMGLQLKNPVIIGSSGLTNSVEKIRDLEENGAAAVVLKSLFEEQIAYETEMNLGSNDTNYPVDMGYIKEYSKDHYLSDYIDLIESVKKNAGIPVIASINCFSDKEWISYARNIEKAGADALELNISLLPVDETKDSRDYEKIYFNLIEKIDKTVSVPLALKIGCFSSGLANLIQKISWTKNVNSMVLFNRYYNPDFDINNYEFRATNILSTPEEISTSLRWIALLSGRVQCDLVASTGIHTAEGVIKQLLAGANAVQVVSTIYKNGPGQIQVILKELAKWMEEKGYNNINDFRGKMNHENTKDATAFERVQFIKYYSMSDYY